jgi:hypothetical protein
MTLRAILFVLLLSGLGRTLGAQVGCADPVPADSAWWRWLTVRAADGSENSQAPRAPSQPRTFRVAQLRGAYVLQMTATLGRERGDHVIADVIIGSDSSGEAKVRDHWPAYFSLGSVAGEQSELTILFDSRSRRLSLLLGNPALGLSDTGVSLDVFTVSDSTMVGRWVDGGLGVDAKSHLHPQGWFCLRRRSF